MKFIYIILILFFTLPSLVEGQTIKELEAKKKKALNELAITNKLLNETQKNKKGTENKLYLLKRSIKQSNEYINTLNSEISVLNRDIDSIQQSKKLYEEYLKQLRIEYAQNCKAIYSHHKVILIKLLGGLDIYKKRQITEKKLLKRYKK